MQKADGAVPGKSTKFDPGKLTVWYKTKYPVCNAGIDFQRNTLVKAVRFGAIDFYDISLKPEALARFGAGP